MPCQLKIDLFSLFYFYVSSSGYGDELAWAAIWLYRATQNVSYLKDAVTFYNQFGLSEAEDFSWDDKAAGVQVRRYRGVFFCL